MFSVSDIQSGDRLQSSLVFPQRFGCLTTGNSNEVTVVNVIIVMDTSQEQCHRL